jgi:putative cell wall-binding protein
VLSPDIDVALQALGYATQRIAGANEYASAVDIAEALGNPATIFDATGLSFQDSLSAVPAAIEDYGALLLTDGTTQAPETAAYLAQFPSVRTYEVEKHTTGLETGADLQEWA